MRTIPRRAAAAAAVVMLATTLALGAARSASPQGEWTDEELHTLRSLSLASLEPLADDPSNRYADDPQAAELGRRLFFDPRLSGNGRVSCASCHQPSRDFQDGTPLGRGVGTTARRTMPLAGTARSAWMFWDGRKDSQWAQALGPLESAVEHGGNRAHYARVVATRYATEYGRIFGASPQSDDRMFANIGKAIAAYERRLEYAPSRFDRYVAAIASRTRAPAPALSFDELAGLRLFIGRADCVSCHGGPLFTDNHFHNIGVAARTGVAPDSGRAAGVRMVLHDEFNCLSRYSDARPDQCAELRFTADTGAELLGAFKTPSLRNVARRAPYMHTGQLATLADVMTHYNRAPGAPLGQSELKPLRLTDRELAQLVAFLNTLTSTENTLP